MPSSPACGYGKIQTITASLKRANYTRLRRWTSESLNSSTRNQEERISTAINSNTAQKSKTRATHKWGDGLGMLFRLSDIEARKDQMPEHVNTREAIEP